MEIIDGNDSALPMNGLTSRIAAIDWMIFFVPISKTISHVRGLRPDRKPHRGPQATQRAVLITFLIQAPLLFRSVEKRGTYNEILGLSPPSLSPTVGKQ